MTAFRQVDVFGSGPLSGNPLAVVHDADSWSTDQMARFANWTNLSETTFLLPPLDAAADYRVRIFTVDGELPFAGHPTLGSAHAWLEAGGIPQTPGRVVQECGVGLVPLHHAQRLAFAAPALLRSGPVEAAVSARVAAALGLAADDVLATHWIDNGPGWIGLEVTSAAAVLRIDPDPAELRGLQVGILGRYDGAGPAGVDAEVRAFYSEGRHVIEDPVTGSLNAGFAQWLIGAGRLPQAYVARQGTAVGRDGRIHIDAADGEIWVGGDTRTVLSGTVAAGWPTDVDIGHHPQI